MRAQTYATLIALLASTGLRVSEFDSNHFLNV